MKVIGSAPPTSRFSTTASPTSRSGWPTLLPSGTRSPASSTSTAPTLAPDGDDAATETPYGYTPEEVQDYINAAQAPGGCDAGNPNYCQHVDGSDTIYITLPARYLPLYQPFIDIGDATGTSALIVPITDFLSPFTQTIIETGYDRTDYSKPQQGTLLPPATFNPIQTAVDLVNDVPEGINMALTPGRTPLPGSPPVRRRRPLCRIRTPRTRSSPTPRRPS